MDQNHQNDMGKQKKRKLKPLLAEWLNDMFSSSSLHGIPYVSKKNNTMVEKIFWILTFLISIALSTLFILQVWDKWQTSPVIVSFSERLVPVGHVPFPSVTICPQRKVMKKVYNYSLGIKNIGLENEDPKITYRDLEMMENVGLICEKDHAAHLPRKLGNLSIINDIIKVSPKIDDVFELCGWRRKYLECSKLFTEVLTSEGLCFNFNSLAANEMITDEDGIHHNYENHNISSKGWTFEDGYDNAVDDPYPRRGREQAGNVDLDIVLKDDISDREILCNSISPGFKVYIQHPTDRPLSFMHYYSIQPKKVSSMAVTVSMLSASDTINKYSPKTRQCFFPHEKKLRHYKIYTPSNCQFECRSNYTFNKCGCVWFNMPFYDTEHYCSLERLPCYLDAIEDLVNMQMKEDADGACNCLPACNSIEYGADVMQAKFKLDATLNAAFADFTDLFFKDVEFARLKMYFKSPRFISMHRSELFGLTDFMANCGGLLGLFLGFSFISLVEIFYFLTIRISCLLLERKKITNEEQNEKQRGWDSTT